MLTGRDALMSIEQAISRTRNEESRLDGALRSAMEEAARLRREEAEGFRTVGQVKLELADAQSGGRRSRSDRAASA